MDVLDLWFNGYFLFVAVGRFWIKPREQNDSLKKN